MYVCETAAISLIQVTETCRKSRRQIMRANSCPREYTLLDFVLTYDIPENPNYLLSLQKIAVVPPEFLELSFKDLVLEPTASNNEVAACCVRNKKSLL